MQIKLQKFVYTQILYESILICSLLVTNKEINIILELQTWQSESWHTGAGDRSDG